MHYGVNSQNIILKTYFSKASSHCGVAVCGTNWGVAVCAMISKSQLSDKVAIENDCGADFKNMREDKGGGGGGLAVQKSSVYLTATHRKTPQHTATHCNTLQRTATHCNALQHARYGGQHLKTTLQHTATHCNTLQHTEEG